jgi:hypothetical protein
MSASLSDSGIRITLATTFLIDGQLVVNSPCSDERKHVPTWLWILIIVVVVLVVVGYFGRGRMSR